MSWISIEDSLYTALTNILPENTNIVIAGQNGPEVKTPYCLIDLLNIDVTGREEVANYCEGDPPNEVFKKEIKETQEAFVRFQFVGKDDNSATVASTLASDFYTALNNPEKRYFFALENLSVMRKTNIVRSRDKRETDIYNAYNVDVIFSFCRQVIETAEYFDTVSASGDLTGSVVDPHNINFTIPS